GYETRDEQTAMALAVRDAFSDNEHLIVEAGTGVGKSFAYLVPGILRAGEHQQRLIVSTYTIALQEQLIQKDLPFLSTALPVEFSAVLGKGRNNYLCFRRLAGAVQNRDKLFSAKQLEQLERVCEWAMVTETGSLQEIDFHVDEAVWSKVRSEVGLCRATKCAHHGKCHLQAARAKMARAQIVVVNHALLFSDLVLRGTQADLLGAYDLIVLDEAHTLEDVASDHFGTSASSANAQYLLRELYNDRTNRGILGLMQGTDAIKAVHR
ncbi:unnamed protein product, partial [marine sediment metagenome]